MAGLRKERRMKTTERIQAENKHSKASIKDGTVEDQKKKLEEIVQGLESALVEKITAIRRYDDWQLSYHNWMKEVEVDIGKEVGRGKLDMNRCIEAVQPTGEQCVFAVGHSGMCKGQCSVYVGDARCGFASDHMGNHSFVYNARSRMNRALYEGMEKRKEDCKEVVDRWEIGPDEKNK